MCDSKLVQFGLRMHMVRGIPLPHTTLRERLPQRVRILFVVALHKADKGRLIIDWGPLRRRANPAFEIGVERLIVPHGISATEMGERFIGDVARNCFLCEARQGRFDCGAHHHRIDGV
jgi:hypothetical protein